MRWVVILLASLLTPATALGVTIEFTLSGTMNSGSGSLWAAGDLISASLTIDIPPISGSSLVSVPASFVATIGGTTLFNAEALGAAEIISTSGRDSVAIGVRVGLPPVGRSSFTDTMPLPSGFPDIALLTLGDSSGTALSNPEDFVPFPSVDRWTSVRFRFHPFGPTASIDSLTIRAVPEPTLPLLVGALVIAAVRRRRV